MPRSLKFGPPGISVDVEDWPQSTWDHSLPISPRAADNTRRVLELFDRAGVHATMFVLGKFAEKFPDVVREIRDAGHEVGCHGYGHVEIFKQSASAFREDIRRAKNLLEQTIGKAVTGYRAPDFSILRGTLWALEILAEEGFAYDSSIFPVRKRRYGIPQWPVEPVRVVFPNGTSIYELPIATVRGLGTNWPIGGGGYHRLMPGFLSRWFTRQALGIAPFVFYCHPYEFDPLEFKELPIPPPLKIRLHQGLGRSRFTKRVQIFLREFGGRTMSKVLDSGDWKSISVADVIPAS